MKFCIDCKNYRVETRELMPIGFMFWLPWEDKTKGVYHTEEDFCVRNEQEPIHGETWPIYVRCLKERKTGGCGPDGLFWEAK
jgi:hypothetical protein